MIKSGCKTASKEASSVTTIENDPITPFRTLAATYKCASSLRPLINQVLSQPKIYAGFADLLHMPHISTLLSTNTSDVAFLHTLELFAYGVYDDYLSKQSQESGYYLSLTDVQLLKLKQLTIVTIISSSAHTTKPYIPYQTLYDKLHITSIRELEDLLMECIYSNIIVGKCDQRTMCFISTGSTISRDIKLEYVNGYINKLKVWKNNTKSLLDILEHTCNNASHNRMIEDEFWNRVDTKGRDVRNNNHQGSNNTHNIVAAVTTTLGKNHLDTSASTNTMDITHGSNISSSSPGDDSSGENSRKASKRSRAAGIGSAAGDVHDFSSTASSYARRG